MYSRFFRFSLLLLTAFIPMNGIQAAVFQPVVTNYTIKDYGVEASQQNWDCDQDEDGTIFVANNNCLLRFDGYSWQQIALNGKAMIRSVHATGDRIYVGAFEAFGYFSRDAYGRYLYTPLASAGGSQQPILHSNEEPWTILEKDGLVYFQTFSNVYVYDGKLVRKLNLRGQHPLFIFKAGNDIFMQAIKGDFYRIDGPNLTKLFGRELVAGDDIAGVLSLHGKDGALVIVTIQHGLYIWDGGQLVKMSTEIDPQLLRAQVNKACITRSGTIVLGTIQSGLWGISHQGSQLWHFDTENGLIDNTVLRLLCDDSDNVWACLDEGISQIACGKPYSTLTVDALMPSVGMVYALHFDGSNMLMATNQGIYDCNITQSGSKPQLVAGTEGQNWHLTDVGTDLLAGNNSGALRIRNGKAERLSQQVSSSTCLRQTTWHDEDILIESTYTNLRIYRKKDQKWQPWQTIDNFNAPIRQIEVDSDGSIWATNMQKGVYHIWLSDDLKRVVSVRHYNKLDSIETRCFVTRFDNRILLADDTRLYDYDKETDKFVPFDTLNRVLPSTSGITNIVPAGGGIGWWVCSQRYYMLVAQQGGEWQLRRCISTAQLGMLGNDCNALAYERDNTVYFNMAHGVASIDLRLDDKPDSFQLFLDEASYKDKHDHYHSLRLTDVLEGKALVDGNILLRFSCPSYSHEMMKFRFTVSGKEDIIVENDQPSLALPNISYGHYTVKAEAIGLDGRTYSTLNAGFEVPRPWYLRWWAFLIYLAVISLGCWAVAQWTARRQLARQHVKMLEQERIIAEQRHQLLQKELSEKSKNLAAMSLDVAVKQNVIKSLRDSIVEQKQKGNISKNYMKAQLQRIQQTSSDKEFWDIFQQNFDLIHDHFFRNLKEQFPSLTANDLKFCALLRLNLSTKEIANFTNLSVRGVESARLRLRHKFQLSPNQNLVEFLIAFK